MVRSGFAPGGRPLWTAKELKTVQRHFPDYAKIQKKLPHRGYSGIKYQARRMGLTTARHMWTGIEVLRLRRHYPTAPKEDLLAAFPGLRWKQIKGKASNIKVRRVRRPLVPTGDDLLDEIRTRATTLGYTMVDVDEISSTKKYFRKARWHGKKNPNHKTAGRAVMALGGRLTAKWEE
jgi:hypothetical protein